MARIEQFERYLEAKCAWDVAVGAGLSEDELDPIEDELIRAETGLVRWSVEAGIGTGRLSEQEGAEILLNWSSPTYTAQRVLDIAVRLAEVMGREVGAQCK